VDAAGANALAQQLVAAGDAILIGDALFAQSVTTMLQARLIAAVEEHHRVAPLSEGLPREEARERIFGAASPPLFTHTLTVLAAEGKLLARERLALPGSAKGVPP
jgi:hypothetical protein